MINTLSVFAAGKAATRGFELEAFKVFLASGNTALSPEEQEAMWNKYKRKYKKQKMMSRTPS